MGSSTRKETSTRSTGRSTTCSSRGRTAGENEERTDRVHKRRASCGNHRIPTPPRRTANKRAPRCEERCFETWWHSMLWSLRTSHGRPSCRNHTLIGVWTTDDRLHDSERPRPEVLVEAQPEAAEAEQQERKRREPRGSTSEEGAVESNAPDDTNKKSEQESSTL